MVLKSFVLVGTIVSHDTVLTTIEFNLNPATNGGPALAIIQNSAIPCEVKVGRKVYVVKQEHAVDATITSEVINENR